MAAAGFAPAAVGAGEFGAFFGTATGTRALASGISGAVSGGVSGRDAEGIVRGAIVGGLVGAANPFGFMGKAGIGGLFGATFQAGTSNFYGQAANSVATGSDISFTDVGVAMTARFSFGGLSWGFVPSGVSQTAGYQVAWGAWNASFAGIVMNW
jgi:hypothetical protein